MSTVSNVNTKLRCVLVAATAFWLAAVGTGASMLHSHDDEPGSQLPHRHLILFGLECPAELPIDGDGPSDSLATAAPTRDSVGPTGGDAIDFLALPQFVSRPTPKPVPQDAPSAPPGRTPSARAIRSAILRA